MYLDCIIEDVFVNYPKTGQNKSELLELSKLLIDKKPKNCLEIGTQFGGTFYLWQKLCLGKVISIDLPCGPFGGIDGYIERNLKLKTERSFFISGDSKDKDVKKQFDSILNGEKLDFLFIDGDHSYHGTKHDYSYYSWYVNPGGVIAFHDIGDNEINNKSDCECRKVFLELDVEKSIIDHQTSWTPNVDKIGGIGIIIKNEN